MDASSLMKYSGLQLSRGRAGRNTLKILKVPAKTLRFRIAARVALSPEATLQVNEEAAGDWNGAVGDLERLSCIFSHQAYLLAYYAILDLSSC